MIDFNKIFGRRGNRFKVRPIVGSITPSQQRFLKRTRKNRTTRFFDHDGDGVISGLDCSWLNKRKHGEYEDRVEDFKKKAKERGYYEYKPQGADQARDFENSVRLFRQNPLNSYVLNRVKMRDIDEDDEM